MRIKIVGGRILTPHREIRDHHIILDGGLVESISSTMKYDDVQKNCTVIDADDCWITPGLVDIHLHGADGSDTMDASAEALRIISRFLIRHGVTSWLPTTLTSSREKLQKAVDNISGFNDPEGAKILGVHLEGPYLNPAYKGAQPKGQIRTAQKEEYAAWLNNEQVKLITAAPEIDGVLELIRLGNEKGITFSVGHSGASFEEMEKAVAVGLTQASHTFNGMNALHHREPGVAGSVLTNDRIFAQVIADGVHLHPAIIKLIIRAKGIDRTILVSDSIRAAGLKNGEYELGGQMVVVKNGTANLHFDDKTTSLAGSTLTLDQAVRNTVKFTNLPFQEVIKMATIVPSKSLGLEALAGEIRTGGAADLVVWDRDLMIKMVLRDGIVVYKRDKD